MATNYALAANGGTASSPDGSDSSYNISRIIDGNDSTEWFPPSAGFPKTAIVTLSAVRSISQIVVKFTAGYKPGSWSVYYKSGGSYTLIETITDNSGSSHTHNFSPVNTDAIKIVSNSIGAGQSNYASWVEIQVWGEPIPVLAVSVSCPTSINEGTNLTPTATISNNIGTTTIRWYLDNVLLTAHNDNATPSINLGSASVGGVKKALKCVVADADETVEETHNIFVGTVSGDANLGYGETQGYTSNVPTPSTLSIVTGGGSVAGSNLTAPNSGSPGSIQIKFTNNADPTVFATKTVTYPEAPPPPVLTDPTQGNGFINLWWNTLPAVGITSFAVQRAEDVNFTVNLIERTDDTLDDGNYHDTENLLFGQIYYYRLWSRIGSVWSLIPSNVVSIVYTEGMVLWKSCKWSYKRPLQIEHLQWQRIYEPLSGNDEAIEDKPQKRLFNLQMQWHGMAVHNDFSDFLDEHRLRKSFLFQTENDSEYIICKIVKAPTEAQMLNYGGFEIVIQEV